MNVGAGDLLRLLAGGVRPEGATGVGPARALDAKSFADLLADVRAGGVASGRPVTVGPRAEGELSEGQLERLAGVADAAEASGATRVGALIDGKIVTLDVLNRTVERVQDRDGAAVTTGIDGFVIVPQEAGAARLFGGESGARAATEGRGHPGLGSIRNRAVAELLGELSGRRNG